MLRNNQTLWKEDIEKVKTAPLSAEQSRRQFVPHPMNTQFGQFSPGAGTERDITASDVKRYFMGQRNIILLCLCVLQLAVFELLAWWIYTRPSWFVDVIVTHEFQDHQALWLQNSMIAVSYLGNMPLLFQALVLLTAVVFFVVRLRLEAIMLVGIFEISRYLNPFLKEMIARPRPSPTRVIVMETTGGTSFPSGHVMSYVAFWGFLFLLGLFVLRGKHWWRIALLIISGVFVVLIGPSRIYLGDHWVTDVAGAYLVEGALLCLMLLLYFKLKEMSPKFKAIGIRAIRRLGSASPGSNTKRS